MSGHSKWSKIKRQKEVTDREKGTTFSKLARLITLSVVESGGVTDPEHNVRLRLAIEKAKELNLPKGNIERAIQNGVGPQTSKLKEVIYEAFGPQKVAFLILSATDNANRTLSEVRNVLERNGGKLTTPGSVSYLFRKAGLMTFKKDGHNEELAFSVAEKIGAFDIDQDKDFFYVYLPFENLGKIKELKSESVKYESAEVDYKPLTEIRIENKGEAKKILTLVEALEELSDVQKVFANFDIPEQLLQ